MKEFRRDSLDHSAAEREARVRKFLSSGARVIFALFWRSFIAILPSCQTAPWHLRTDIPGQARVQYGEEIVPTLSRQWSADYAASFALGRRDLMQNEETDARVKRLEASEERSICTLIGWIDYADELSVIRRTALPPPIPHRLRQICSGGRSRL
jgi:hypothetical protein